MIEIVLTLEGVACPKCEERVNAAVRQRPEVKSVSTSHISGECSVVCGEEIDREALISSIESAGYKVVGTVEKSYVKKSFLKRLFGK